MSAELGPTEHKLRHWTFVMLFPWCAVRYARTKRGLKAQFRERARRVAWLASRFGVRLPG